MTPVEAAVPDVIPVACSAIHSESAVLEVAARPG